MSAGKWVLRIWGMHYEYEPVHREVWTLCWATKEGHASRDQRQAFLFDCEDDAWTFAAGAELLGHDPERGDWCFPEEVK